MADVATLYIRIDSDGSVKASKNLKELSKQGATTAKQIDKTTASTDRFNKATERSAAHLNRFSSGTKTVGRDVQRYGLLIAGAAAATVKFGNELTKGLGQVQTLIPGTGDRIYELEDAVQSLATESGKGFNELTEGLYQTISAFQDGEDTLERFETATRAAVAGGASVADSVELASAVTKAYGDTTAEATQKVLDLAFETVRLGQTTFPQLASGIQTATDSAVRLGVSQEELFATFSALTGVVGDASEVATKFRSASASLLNPNEALLVLFGQLSEQTGEVVEDGEDFVRVAGGWQEALALIVKTAEASGEPLQTYIRRIEGITLASRLATNSTDKFIADLEDMGDASGALDRSFKEATEGIDKFAFSMAQSRRQIEVALSEISKNLLPVLDDLLKNVASVVTAFSELDTNIQATVIAVGGFVIALGPALIALGGLLRAIQLIQALQFASTIVQITKVIGPAGLVGALALVGVGMAAFINNTKDAIEEQKILTEAMASSNGVIYNINALAEKYDAVNDVSVVNRDLNKDLIEQYPELAGSVDIYDDSLEDVYAKLVRIKQLEMEDAFENQRKELLNLRGAVRNSAEEYGTLSSQIEDTFRKIYGEEATFDIGTFIESVLNEEATSVYIDKYFLRVVESFRENQQKLNTAISGFEGSFDRIKEEIESTGLFEVIPDEVEGFKLIPRALEDVLKEVNDIAEDGVLPPTPDTGDGGDTLKTWQEWFEEVTGIAKEKFGSSGAQAGILFSESLVKEASDAMVYADLFGGNVDFSDLFSDQLDRAKAVFKELSQIPAEEIAKGEIFQTLGINAAEFDNVMASLLSTIVKLQEQTKDGILTDLDQDKNRVDDLAGAFPNLTTQVGVLEDKLAASRKAFQELLDSDVSIMADEVKQLANEIANLEDKLAILAGERFSLWARDLTRAFYRMSDAAQFVAVNVDGFQELIANTINTVSNLAIDSLSQSFYEWGKIVGDSAKDFDDWKDAMNGMLKSILDTLPAMFIQAGLQQLILGNVALGLGLIAAGLTGSFLSGLVQGTTDQADEEASGTETNAAGAVYSYAKGAALGSFENSIVNTPTMFNNGAGLMGERGPEAIMPLTRMRDGNLGVQAGGSGGDTNVNVTVVNNTKEDVTTNETVGADGTKEIEVIVGSLINKSIREGKTDAALNERYGVKMRGYN